MSPGEPPLSSPDSSRPVSRRPVLYPFLAAVYSVLALAAANGGELVRPEAIRSCALNMAIGFGPLSKAC